MALISFFAGFLRQREENLAVVLATGDLKRRVPWTAFSFFRVFDVKPRQFHAELLVRVVYFRVNDSRLYGGTNVIFSLLIGINLGLFLCGE